MLRIVTMIIEKIDIALRGDGASWLVAWPG
jgi:hypothetical protein